MKLRLRQSVLGNAHFGLVVGLALVAGVGCSDDDSIPEIPLFDGGSSSDTLNTIDTDTTNGGGGTTDPTDTDSESSDTSNPTDTLDVNPTDTSESSTTSPTDPTETTGDTSGSVVTSDPTSETTAPTSAPTSDPGATSDPGSSSEEFVNLITNGGFESGSAGWTTWGGTTLAVSTAKARSGQQSLLASGGVKIGPVVTEVAPIVPGGTYRASFWVTVGTGTAQIHLVRYIACTNDYVWIKGDTTVSADNWTELSADFTVPEDCTSPSFRVYVEGDGDGTGVELYVDDVTIYLIDVPDPGSTDTSGTDTSGIDTGSTDPVTTDLDVDSGVVDTGETLEDPDASVDTGETIVDPDAGDASSTEPVDTEPDASVSTGEETTEPEPTNLVSNGTFETGAAGWYSWVGTAEASSVKFRTGLQSLYVSGAGPNQAATLVNVQAGMTYNVSMWASLETVGLANIHVVRSLAECDPEFSWAVGNTAVGNTGWTQLSGSFTVPLDCTATTAQVFPEAVPTEVNFYIDDVVVTEAVD